MISGDGTVKPGPGEGERFIAGTWIPVRLNEISRAGQHRFGAFGVASGGCCEGYGGMCQRRHDGAPAESEITEERARSSKDLAPFRLGLLRKHPS